MIKAVVVTLALTTLVACSDAPRPTSAEPRMFSVVSEFPDSAAGRLMIVITVPKLSGPPQVKAAAESIIADRKDKYQRITVKSFVEDSNLDGPPYAVSKLENGSVEHVFSAAPGGSVRIPTH